MTKVSIFIAVTSYVAFATAATPALSEDENLQIDRTPRSELQQSLDRLSSATTCRPRHSI